MISVIIIHRNGIDHLFRCLRALEKSTRRPGEVIVVDDATDEDPTERIREEFPYTHMLRHEEWRGTTAARMTGAREAHGDLLMFLDCDVEVTPECLAVLERTIRDERKIGIVGAELRTDTGARMRWNCGYDPNHLREAIGYGFGALIRTVAPLEADGQLREFSQHFTLNYGKLHGARDVDWVAEAAGMVRRDAFDRVGGFDEAFRMFFEGQDLCRRIREAGWRVRFVPAAIARIRDHHAATPVDRGQLRRASKRRFYRKHYSVLSWNPVTFWLGQAVARLAHRLA